MHDNKDIYYTALLPVSKRAVVKSKCGLLVLAQMTQLLISPPFAVLRLCLLPEGNPAGIEANVAYYGFGFVMYALFNLIFLPVFFKTAWKAGKAFLLAMIPAALVVLFMEVIVYIPGYTWLDSVSPDMMLRQWPLLLFGIAFYAGAKYIAYRLAAARFERVDW